MSSPQNSRIPFSTKEPAAWQADIVVNASGIETHTFTARKADKRRIDIDKNVTEILAGSRFVIDHTRKIYYEEPPTGAGPNGFVSPAASFFVGPEYSSFEMIGSEGNITKYKVRREGSSDAITISFDTAAGLIVAQEFTAADGSANVKYELRDLKLEVDDGAFAVPAGYRKVTAAEYRQAQNERPATTK